MAIPTPDGYVPSHPGLFVVDFKPGEYSSSLIALKDLLPGAEVPLRGLTPSPKKYSTLQYGPGPDDHVELNSDLLFVNHSCEPNVAFDLSSSDRSQWNLRALKSIRAGEPLTFFYPSTEWQMDQPFECRCGAPSCIGKISGAVALSKDTLLQRHFISPWVLTKVAERDRPPDQHADQISTEY
ncbi:hypothetical protein FA95DRAFT_1622988 [Auriscalpium vulgare]|uniref:Uncharacterized protein n=1 Tax=Auriscalpium vulgare TaxID=40419 RepID=A0ACB8RLK3_9AGAM|nr:hypothetical protein FA95DRAFT_1622988 [Auriscalpium vulgare]